MSWAPRPHEKRQKDAPRVVARGKRLRADVTASERRCWKLLRQINREGAHFRRQAPVGKYVYDFADHGARLLVELDGVVHELIDDVVLRDALKDDWAMSQGYVLLRLKNREVWSSPDTVLDRIRAALRSAPRLDRPPPLAPPHKGEGDE